ncbi:hypothetical protein KIPB_001410 [Kipferlia bialata]|uniref:Regulator of chromosome condensation 1/beta-lactamase-inhibitor protein II n=1 Tax=Kipferlia bialata TaxID=797122 RepID=A0A9K3CQI3_9EUKA|nr:hypothetical protein KIPB_000192 [Kipferlia bialata]GIQ80585.1 hypothetical protein KIPB_001410 [Kipferlia bialata]|eukprot:g192.t1
MRTSPYEVPFDASIKVAQVAVGDTHTACITSDGSLYTWGTARQGCCADGNLSTHKILTPYKVSHRDGSPVSDAVQIQCSSHLTLVLTSDGTVYSCGGGDFGRLGTGSKDACAWLTKVDPLPKCRSITAGSLYAAAITAAPYSGASSTEEQDLSTNVPSLDTTVGSDETGGDLYMWGCNTSGALGLGHRRHRTRPTRVDMPVGVVDVGCTKGQVHPRHHQGKNLPGSEGQHTLMAGSDGCLYTCGTAHKGMLGNYNMKVFCPSDGDELTPYRVGSRTRDGKNPKYLEGKRVTQVCSAHIHSYLASEDGYMYTFGCGSNGRCGVDAYPHGVHGTKSRLKCYLFSPHRLDSVQDKHAHFICVSRYNSMAIMGPRE